MELSARQKILMDLYKYIVDDNNNAELFVQLVTEIVSLTELDVIATIFKQRLQDRKVRTN